MRNKALFFVVFLILSIISCTSKGDGKTNKEGLVSSSCSFQTDIYSDKKLYKQEFLDEKVKIGEGLFTIKVVRDKFNKDSIPYNFKTENWWENESPSTLLIYDNSSCELIFSKKFDGVKVTLSKLKGKLSKDGNLYLHLISSGGGSGYISWLNIIEIINHRIQIQPIFDSNELSVILFDKNEQNIILMNGIWDMSGWSEEEEGEAHFSPHVFSIYKYILNGQTIKKVQMGSTSSKYELEYKTAKEFFKTLIKKEPGLKIKENLSNYIGFNNWTGEFN